MGNIVELDEHREHAVCEVMCWNCAKRWIAVIPVGTWLKEIECPGCGKIGYAFKTGQDLMAT